MTDTTGNHMTCDAVAEHLADYLEDDASERVRTGVEAHAASCASCATLLADLRAISADAAALPPLAPARDLWAGIAERIDARVLPLDAGPSRVERDARRGWVRPAVAAAALVLFTAGVTNWLTRASLQGGPAAVALRDTSAPVHQVARAEPVDVAAGDSGAAAHARPLGDRVGPLATVDEPASRRLWGDAGGARRRTEPDGATMRVARVRAAEPRAATPARLASAAPAAPLVDPVYDRDIVALRRLVNERGAQLDPATVAVLEQSIAVIDSAIAQSRAALAKDPASRFLATQLNHSLEKKVELLRTAAMLPART